MATIKLGSIACSPPVRRCWHCWEPIEPSRDTVWMRHATQKLYSRYDSYHVGCALEMVTYDPGDWIVILPDHRQREVDRRAKRRRATIVDLTGIGWGDAVADVVAGEKSLR